MKISNLLGESINCKSCGKILKQPVVLPCGHSICKHHETEDNNQNIECIKCNKSFEIPSDGFAPNCDLESLLLREINELDLGEKQCKSNVSLIKSDIDLDVKLKVWAYDLTNWERSLNSFKRDINKWEDLSTEIIMDLQTEYLKFNDGLFLNRLNDFWPQLSIMSNFQTIR